jgi:hypothetical protein
MTEASLEAPIPESHVGILENALLAMVSTISYKDGLISTNPLGSIGTGTTYASAQSNRR